MLASNSLLQISDIKFQEAEGKLKKKRQEGKLNKKRKTKKKWQMSLPYLVDFTVSNMITVALTL